MATKLTMAIRIIGFARSFVGLTGGNVSRRGRMSGMGKPTAFANEVVVGGTRRLEFLIIKSTC